MDWSRTASASVLSDGHAHRAVRPQMPGTAAQHKDERQGEKRRRLARCRLVRPALGRSVACIRGTFDLRRRGNVVHVASALVVSLGSPSPARAGRPSVLRGMPCFLGPSASRPLAGALSLCGVLTYVLGPLGAVGVSLCHWSRVQFFCVSLPKPHKHTMLVRHGARSQSRLKPAHVASVICVFPCRCALRNNTSEGRTPDMQCLGTQGEKVGPNGVLTQKDGHDTMPHPSNR